MIKSKIFFILSLGFIGGITMSSFLYPKKFEILIIYLVAISGFIISAVFYENKKVVIWSLAGIVFVFGTYLTGSKLKKLENPVWDAKEFQGEVVVEKEPIVNGNRQQIIVIPKARSLAGQRLSLWTGAYADYAYGDELMINCLMKIPENVSLDFDYRMYLAKDGVYYECRNPKIEKTGKHSGNAAYGAILKIKGKLQDNILRLFPAPESGLMIGLLIGGDDNLSKNVQEDFSKTGMTHIVAVSGYNVAIVAEYLMILGISFGLWRSQAFYFAVAGIISFVILVGFPSSAVRAGAMGILLIWAMKNGRLANSQNAILAAAVLMLLANPLLLRWDIGFQLSFLATLGIVYLYPVFENFAIRRAGIDFEPVSAIIEILFLTISAQIFVLPVILLNFHKLSIISPLANLLVLPLVPISMLLGFVAVVSSFIFFPLGQIFSWIAYLPLKLEMVFVRYFSSLKYSSVEMTIMWWAVAVWYIILLASLSYWRTKADLNKKILDI